MGNVKGWTVGKVFITGTPLDSGQGIYHLYG